MATTTLTEEREYGSGDIVDPGYYVDIDTGAIVQVREPDELPAGSRTILYRRRFKHVPAEKLNISARLVVRSK